MYLGSFSSNWRIREASREQATPVKKLKPSALRISAPPWRAVLAVASIEVVNYSGTLTAAASRSAKAVDVAMGSPWETLETGTVLDFLDFREAPETHTSLSIFLRELVASKAAVGS